jgi:SIR2-like domain
VYQHSPEIKSISDRLFEAASLPPATWQELRELARQLNGLSILPLLGAGASYDCGQPLASVVAEDMYGQFGSVGQPSDLKRSRADLGVVADAFYLRGEQKEAVDALSLSDTSKWPASREFRDHFCGYRVLARLAREGIISEAISLNYDCGFERALEDEGFGFDPFSFLGREWLDHATVVSGGADHVVPRRRGELVLTKAHGCAATYRRNIKSATTPDLEKAVREEVIVRRSQLMDWRGDFWARDLFADRARTHVILLMGISGQDPVIHIALTRALEEAFKRLPQSEVPRVVAIDVNPDTVSLKSLLHQGCGRRSAPPGMIDRIEVPAGKSLSSVVIALGVEMIALRLARQGIGLASDRPSRVISAMITTPAALRWSYRLERRTSGSDLYQRAKVRMSKERAYVPIESNPRRVREALHVRRMLGIRLGFGLYESVAQAVDGRGFVVAPRRGRAYLPLGITVEELFAARPSELRDAARELEAPHGLDPVLVVRNGAELRGRSVYQGEAVTI